MLVISRRRGERIRIGDVVLVVLSTHRGSVRLGFEAPTRGVLIIRDEIAGDDETPPTQRSGQETAPPEGVSLGRERG